jgi:hypothetical protein
MAATVGEARPCQFCGRPGRVFAVVGDWAPAVCGDCEGKAVRWWTRLEAQEARQRECLRRKKERAHGLIAISARG